MPFAEQCDHQQVYDFLFTDDDATGVLANRASSLLHLANFICLCHLTLNPLLPGTGKRRDGYLACFWHRFVCLKLYAQKTVFFTLPSPFPYYLPPRQGGGCLL